MAADERVGPAIDPYWLPLGAGEMWNSNSTIARLIARSGLGTRWRAGVVVARRRHP